MSGERMTISRTLSDGTTVTGHPEHVSRALLIDGSMCAEEAQWVAELRAGGVKASHPNDGWVDRAAYKVHLCYPQFNDGLEVGDLLALGSPGRGTWLVRVTGSSENLFALPEHPKPWYWHFKDA